MHEIAQRPSGRRSLDRINSRGKKKIDICCVGRGVNYHSLFYLSIVMMSPVEFSTGELRAKQV